MSRTAFYFFFYSFFNTERAILGQKPPILGPSPFWGEKPLFCWFFFARNLWFSPKKKPQIWVKAKFRHFARAVLGREAADLGQKPNSSRRGLGAAFWVQIAAFWFKKKSPFFGGEWLKISVFRRGSFLGGKSGILGRKKRCRTTSGSGGPKNGVFGPKKGDFFGVKKGGFGALGAPQW